MSRFRDYALIYLAALATVAEMEVAAVVENGRFFPPLRFFAPALGLISLTLILWPIYTLQQYQVTTDRSNYMAAAHVVDSGLYAIIRHPQYLGYMGLNITFMLISHRWLTLLLGMSAILLFYLHTLQEEKQLIEKFGAAYQDYMQRVPRFNLISGAIRAMWQG